MKTGALPIQIEGAAPPHTIEQRACHLSRRLPWKS